MRTISFDGVIVGGGGAGMRAALAAWRSLAIQDGGDLEGVSDSLAHRIRSGGHHLCAIASADPQRRLALAYV